MIPDLGPETHTGHISRDCPNNQSDCGYHHPPGLGGYGRPPSPKQRGQVNCYACGRLGHMARECPTNRGGARRGYRGGPRGAYGGTHRDNDQGQNGGVHVNLCSTMTETRDMAVQSDDSGQINLITQSQWEFGNFPAVDAIIIEKSAPSVRVYPLQYVNVNVSGCDCVALEDSGCQIPIVSKRMFSRCCDDDSVVGKVLLHGFGKNHTAQAPLVTVTVRLRDDAREDVVEISLVCAVADLCSAEYDVILPADVVHELQATSVAANVLYCDVDDVCDVGTVSGSTETVEDTPEDVDKVPVASVEVDSTALADEQRQDPPSTQDHKYCLCVVDSCTCVNGCAVIKSDIAIGDVVTPTPAVVSCDVPSVRVEDSKITHLSPDQGRKQLQLLDEFGDRSSVRPGRCDAIFHRTQTTADFVSRQMRAYRVPDAVESRGRPPDPRLACHVTYQASDSSGASPIVCLARKTLLFG